METDPRRWIGALRASHERLVGRATELDDAALGTPSMCTEWSVAQVLSHLGSGAEIARDTLTAAIEDRDTLDDAGREAIWAVWNARSPREMATAFVAADGQLVEAFEGLDTERLEGLRVTMPFLPDPIDVATFAGLRLGEHALHSWDVAAAFDGDAELAPDATALLVDTQPAIVALVGGFMPRDTRPAGGATITVATTEPARCFELELGDRAALRPIDLDAAGSAHLAIPAEALVRLTAGRLKPGSPSARLEPWRGITIDELRTAFPGY